MRIISDTINIKCNFYPKTTAFTAMFNLITTHTLHSEPIFFLFLETSSGRRAQTDKEFQKKIPYARIRALRRFSSEIAQRSLTD